MTDRAPAFVSAPTPAPDCRCAHGHVPWRSNGYPPEHPNGYLFPFLKSVAAALWAAFVILPVCAVAAQEGDSVPDSTSDSSTLDRLTDIAVDGVAAAGLFSSGVDYAGTGRGRVNWREGYVSLGLSLTRALSGGGAALYGRVSLLASATDGEGDAAGFTTGAERTVAHEDAYAGIRLDRLAGGRVTADLSVGSRYFQIGDGFLVAGDAVNFGDGLGPAFDRGGAYWLGSRRAFRRTAILRLAAGAARMQVFRIGSATAAQARMDLGGVNLDYHLKGVGDIGLAWLRVLDVDTGLAPRRRGLATYNIRYVGAPLRGLSLRGELAVQRSSRTDADSPRVRAFAAYGEVSYRPPAMALSPEIVYRYSRFSGDDPATPDTFEGFDPLFYGFTRGYGTWFQGEVAGNYAGPFNSNAHIHTVRLYIRPHRAIRLGLLGFDFAPRTRAAAFAPAREINLTMEWDITERLFLSPVYGLYSPRAASGGSPDAGPDDRRDNHHFQLFAQWRF
ncbi:hypothetical protein [Eilatimonas milleporae]|uniref:Alginate export protein n=1 Tax=Eilatimonas milleporae TaxID=911205 RepID=A0A3M0BTM2_9PROT|nr:hypothetical protein [Eilatimonas milleporae]RMB00678.1 hypothetical protein BXY39_3866 [Eilatimonas milleporae]